MAPPRKRARLNKDDKVAEGKATSALLPDARTAWLVKGEEQSFEIVAKGETLVVSRNVLTSQSEYFAACLKPPFVESQGTVRLDDVDPKYLSLYIGVAYCHASMIPMTPPQPSPCPEAHPPRSSLKELVEVYKLCDRFISTNMATFMLDCIGAFIGDGHRAMFRSGPDEAQQRTWIRDFADGYEALDPSHSVQQTVLERIIEYFCDGVSFNAWTKLVDEIMDCPRFVGHVSKNFAEKLADGYSRKRLKRLERKGPP